MADRLRLVGQTVDGRYAVEALIGEGAVGAVYRAQNLRLGKVVALKAIRGDFLKDPAVLQRWLDEVAVITELRHPNIVDSTDSGELPDGSRYIVLEFLEGRQLSDAIQHSGRLSIRRSMRITRQIVAALEAVHARGILHRDLRSDNIFLVQHDDASDLVKVLDFGVARIQAAAGPGSPGQPIASPVFMSPEQIADPEQIDERADVYAVGAVMYHMLSGQKPYPTNGPIPTLLRKILSEAPTPLPDDIPRDVRDIVTRAMARDPASRIQTMRELGRQLDLLPHGTSTPMPKVPAVAEPEEPTPAPMVPPAAARPTPVPVPSAPVVARGKPTKLPLILLGGIGLLGVAIAAVVILRPRAEKTSQVAANDQTPTFDAAPTSPATPEPKPPRVAGNPAAPDAAPPPVPDTTPAPDAAAAPELDAGGPGSGAVSTPARPTPRPPVRPPPTSDADAAKRGDAERAKLDAERAKAEARAKLDAERAKAEADRLAVEQAKAKAEADRLAADQAKAAQKPKLDPNPRPPTPPTPTKSTVDATAIRAAVKTKLGSIMACYERARMDDPTLAGSVTVQITEAPDGRVTKADVAASTLGSPATERCIVAEIGRWRLPPPIGGGSATFAYPFTLR